MKHVAAIPLALVLAIMMGCAALGLSAPETFNQKLAVGYATVTTIRDTATLLLNTGKINAADGTNVLNSTDAARAGLDTAREIGKTDPAAAEFKVNSVRTILTALGAYLASKGAK